MNAGISIHASCLKRIAQICDSLAYCEVLIMEDEANQIVSRRVSSCVKAARLVYKHTDVLLRHV